MSTSDITWKNIKEHDKPSNNWFVIDGKVYDVTVWSKKHPGGHRIINHFAAQDASEAFRAFHQNPTALKKQLLPAFNVGDLKDEEVASSELQKKKNIYMEDFEQLRLRVIQMGGFEGNTFFFAAMFIHILCFECLAYLNLWYWGVGYTSCIVSALLYATAQAQASWLQHDFGHNSVFRSIRWNNFCHEITMGLLKGASCNWWNHLHNQHHAKPNVINKDPDVRLQPLLVVGKTLPREAALDKEKNKNAWHFPYQYQHIYFFLTLPPLLFPFYFQAMTFRHMIIRRVYKDIPWVAGFYLKLFVLYYPLLGFWGTVGYLLVVRMIESHWFAWVSQSNHIPMDIDHDTEEAWLIQQLKATCNIEPSWFNNWFTGHLNFQVEHHLFPTMPRHNYAMVQPLVKELCARHNLDYVEKSLGTAFADIIRSLYQSAQLFHNSMKTKGL